MTVTDHILLASIPVWSHLRPLIALACKIAQQRRHIGVTILSGGPYHELASKEVERHFAEGGTGKDNIRVITLLKEELGFSEVVPTVQRKFRTFYDSILDDLPIECAATGKKFHGWPKPSVIVADIFFLVYKHVRHSTPDVRIFFFNCSSAAAILRLVGPEELGGVGDFFSKARAVARATGSDFLKIAEELHSPIYGDVIHLPGLAPMYDYEMFPQILILDAGAHRDYHHLAAEFLVKADGIISATSVAYESEAAKIFKNWSIESGRRFYAVGPVLPPSMTSGALSVASKQHEKDTSHNGSEIEEFLNGILKSHGENSILYISFGTFFWPSIDQLQKVIDVLLELDFPFLLAHGSPLAVIPPELAERVKASKIGLLSLWAPQHLVLNHPATGWFLTHCGHNSATEALTQGVPMIAWPMAADQPVNAAQVSLVLDVAYELIEVRAGEAGLKPLYRGVQPTGTLEAMEAEFRKVVQAARGPDGEKKRNNARAIRDKIRLTWKEGGEALRELETFLSKEFPNVA